jgi:hypothetical protein
MTSKKSYQVPFKYSEALALITSLLQSGIIDEKEARKLLGMTGDETDLYTTEELNNLLKKNLFKLTGIKDKYENQ